MTVSVGGNRRPRSGTRLYIDSSDDPITGRPSGQTLRSDRPWSSANPRYAPPKNDNSFRGDQAFNDFLDSKFGEGESLARQSYIDTNERGNWAADMLSPFAQLLSRLKIDGPQQALESIKSDYLFRQDPRRVEQYVRGDGRGRADGMANQQKRQALSAKEAKTLQDYLLEAEGVLGKGPDFDIIRQRYLQNAKDSDAKLQAMFNQLNSSYAANAAPIQQSYDQARATIDQAGQQGVANVNAGYDAARNAQTQQLAALGIGDAAAVLAQDGEMAADQGMATGGISRDAANYAGLNATNAQSAQQFNTGMQGAAALGGAESRALLQRSLMDNLAGLAFKESEYAPRQRERELEYAMMLQARDQPGGLNPWQQAQMDQRLAEFIAEQNQINYENSVGQSDSQRDIFFRLLEQYDGNTDQLMEMYAWMQENGLR